VNRRILVLASLAFVLITVGVVTWLRPTPQPTATVARTAPAVPPAAPPTLVPTPPPSKSAPPSDPRRVAPRAPVETLAPEPTPAPPSAPADARASEGSLHFESDVAGAQVFIDRQFVGATPVTAEHVKLGTHRVNASVEGFDGIVDTIEVSPGSRDITIRFREVRLDARLAVIHKHRIGSCKGQLVATPQGLRYETADKDDGFSVPLLGLEMFQVDYLEKNLKLKAPSGKTYNFTDPDGNADRLFVFHRDVDKARNRLQKGDRPATP
jgi:hypothetical protein